MRSRNANSLETGSETYLTCSQHDIPVSCICIKGIIVISNNNLSRQSQLAILADMRQTPTVILSLVVGSIVGQPVAAQRKIRDRKAGSSSLVKSTSKLNPSWSELNSSGQGAPEPRRKSAISSDTECVRSG